MRSIFGINLTRRIIIGLALIYLAGIFWLGEAIIPFTHLPHKLGLFTVLLVAGELTFIAGVAVLGKPLYRQLKARLTAYIKQKTAKN